MNPLRIISVVLGLAGFAHAANAGAGRPNVFILPTDDQGTPEVKDHAKEQPEIVKELMVLHQAWEKDLEAN